MSNPTSNYGWQMPTATDLVTDLPADFEVFGQAVDTALMDLKGGTTGQVLSKASATDMDFTWVAANPGDITGVTAGTGISGGGTSGTVTVSIDTAVTADLTTAQTLTNKTLTSPALTTPTISTATTNGDLLYGTGSGALARRGIGSTGNVLTVSGGIPVWSAPAGGGKIAQVVAYEGSNTLALTTSYVTVDSLAITPTSATSKIYASITVLAKPRNSSGAGSTTVDFQLFRGATLVSATSTAGTSFVSITQNEGGPIITVPMVCLDSPATTSATTYNLKAKADNTTQTSYAQRCYITLWEVLA